VYLNEPLSMLQRLAETLEYTELLDEAVKHEDSCIRMAYLMAFAITPYSSSINRSKKPFNPMLGETFEYHDKKKNLYYISEQVSHHPPISASHCESRNFKYLASSNVKLSMGLTGVTVTPLSSNHIILPKRNDHFFYKTHKILINIIGKVYTDFFGDMVCENKNGDRGYSYKNHLKKYIYIDINQICIKG
jgi:oxysterol-binding protein 1